MKFENKKEAVTVRHVCLKFCDRCGFFSAKEELNEESCGICPVSEITMQATNYIVDHRYNDENNKRL